MVAGLLAGGGSWLARRGVLVLSAMRRRGANLVATRGDPAPGWWLVAHLDSKSQPVPMLARAAGITVLALAWLAAIVLAWMQAGGVVGGGAWWWVAGVGIVAATPVALSLVRAGPSRGALDDASGVAAVLLAAACVPATTPLGVLLTSAEELGLAGARAFAAVHPAATAINIDTLDDRGRLAAMYWGRQPGALSAAAREAARAIGARLEVQRLLPGILVDGVALANAGWATLTLSRGAARTLARVHSAGDVPDGLDGSGAAEGARLVVEMLARLA